MSVVDDVVALIDRDELVSLALKICNIDSAVGHEGEVGQYLYSWLENEGFAARKIGLASDRFNVLGTLPGAGTGRSLIFNSHMDTAVPREADLVHLHPTDAAYHQAWVEGEMLVGEGICNDKGPMAAFLIAARAIKRSGHNLLGDLLVSAVINETGGEPCDDAPGIYTQSKDVGARYLVTHGAVADYALVAEGTGFGLVWVEAGEFWYKVTLRSSQPPYYTPYLPPRSAGLASSPNMIVAAAAVIEQIERWAAGYQERMVYQCAGGTVVPKVQIGAIRSGDTNRPLMSPQICNLYIDVRSVPGQDPLATRAEISAVIASLGIDHTVDLYHFRPGYEAKNIGPLTDAVKRAHRATFGDDPPTPMVETSSMWRDVNVFNELGIPALTYGPRSAVHSHKRALTIDSLYEAACVYARVAVDICSQEKKQ